MTAVCSKLNFAVLADGRLANLSDWNEGVVHELAARDGITLSDDHWEVINAMRDYYQSYNVSPVKKLLKRSLKQGSGSDRFSDAHLSGLFPGGVLVQGSKLSGIPIPMLDVELERSTYTGKAAPSKSHFTGSFDFEGESYRVTALGNLIDLHRWNKHLAYFMAEREGIKLTGEHWEVLNFLRQFYFEYGITPMVRILMQHMEEELGAERASKEHLYQLFPKGPSRQGSRIAGLPEPQGCIDSDD
jgi:tRNA 2-thiouridine synthesizing protein E